MALLAAGWHEQPVRGVDPHKQHCCNLCPVHHFPLEVAVLAHGAKVNAICHTIDGVQDWIDGRKEVVPSGHVFQAFHVAGKHWQVFLRACQSEQMEGKQFKSLDSTGWPMATLRNGRPLP